MAKKKNSTKGSELSSDEILDSLAEDVGADKAAAAAPVASKKKNKKQAPVKAERPRWPVDKDHGSVTRMLTGDDAADRVDLSDIEKGKGGLGSMVLLILFVVCAAVGIWQLRKVSSPETLAAKQAEREAIEQANLVEQLAKQKKYGMLRIESTPAQAVIFKNGERMVIDAAGDAAEGAGGAEEGTAPTAAAPGTAPTAGQKVVMTPANLMNLDIALTYKIRIEKEGYEPFEFGVAEHVWTKDSGTGEYKLIKMIELTPNVCEYWWLYDGKQKKEVHFEGWERAECGVHFDEAVSAGVSVTECACKQPPEGTDPITFKDAQDKKRDEAAAKASKKKSK